MTDAARPYVTAAAHYLRGRPPYSAQLLDVMRAELGLDGTGTLIDVGCGPGVLAVQLAPLFDTVIGIDPEPAMLAEASRHAAAHHVNVVWIEARAEDLANLELPAARLVIFGQSLHWTDHRRVLAVVYSCSNRVVRWPSSHRPSNTGRRPSTGRPGRFRTNRSKR
jgi:trans-aconitate methyltransferase